MILSLACTGKTSNTSSSTAPTMTVGGYETPRGPDVLLIVSFFSPPRIVSLARPPTQALPGVGLLLHVFGQNEEKRRNSLQQRFLSLLKPRKDKCLESGTKNARVTAHQSMEHKASTPTSTIPTINHLRSPKPASRPALRSLHSLLSLSEKHATILRRPSAQRLSHHSQHQEGRTHLIAGANTSIVEGQEPTAFSLELYR